MNKITIEELDRIEKQYPSRSLFFGSRNPSRNLQNDISPKEKVLLCWCQMKKIGKFGMVLPDFLSTEDVVEYVLITDYKFTTCYSGMAGPWIMLETVREIELLKTSISWRSDSSDFHGLILFQNPQDGHQILDVLQQAIAHAKVRIRSNKDTTMPTSLVDQLAKLAELHQNHAISDGEYEAAKRKILT